jgi:pantoate--beta-alanine ligase
MPPLETKKEIKTLLKGIKQKESLGLVPTMGALHNGHASLIKKALKENDHVVVSIFVNPTQFNNVDDLKKYPKTIEEDLTLIKGISSKIIVFAPSIKEIYNDNVAPKTYDFSGLDKVMEGEFRDDHFNGVGTIVEQLFTVVEPDKAYFGEKDFQQLRIIRKLVQIQNLPVQIIGCPIVRETNGLAMSSRNERLTTELRQKAGFIYETLQTAKKMFGTKSVLNTKEWVKERFQNQPDLKLEYFEITDIETLTPTKTKKDTIKYRAFIAVYAKEVRLIDNIALN